MFPSILFIFFLFVSFYNFKLSDHTRNKSSKSTITVPPAFYFTLLTLTCILKNFDTTKLLFYLLPLAVYNWNIPFCYFTYYTKTKSNIFILLSHATHQCFTLLWRKIQDINLKSLLIDTKNAEPAAPVFWLHLHVSTLTLSKQSETVRMLLMGSFPNHFKVSM